MTLSDDDIRKYQEIYRKKFGRTLSADEAQGQALALIDLVRVLHEPLHSDAAQSFMDEFRSQHPTYRVKL